MATMPPLTDLNKYNNVSNYVSFTDMELKSYVVVDKIDEWLCEIILWIFAFKKMGDRNSFRKFYCLIAHCFASVTEK